ncbi:MAG: hypothetical protein IJO27_00125, partial [Bacilli bacterium]|nr:hypothetical protein [Bacilli bacterium]
MNYKKILFIIICISTFINVDAVCDSQRLNELKNKASKIEFIYDYTKNSNSEINFKITAVNLDEEIKTLIIKDYYMDDYREFKYNKNKQSSLSGFKSGERVKVTFKAYTTDECSGKTVYSKTVSLPYYNNYYNSSQCKQYPKFKYCENEL